jgi:hypothetical protein
MVVDRLPTRARSANARDRRGTHPADEWPAIIVPTEEPAGPAPECLPLRGAQSSTVGSGATRVIGSDPAVVRRAGKKRSATSRKFRRKSTWCRSLWGNSLWRRVLPRIGQTPTAIFRAHRPDRPAHSARGGRVVDNRMTSGKFVIDTTQRRVLRQVSTSFPVRQSPPRCRVLSLLGHRDDFSGGPLNASRDDVDGSPSLISRTVTPNTLW